MNGYKILITYNYLTHREAEYRRFMIHRWMPAMQELGFEPGEVLHTMWGEYPMRLVVLYSKDLASLEEAMVSDEWQEWHQSLSGLVRNLRYRVVTARPWLQY